MGQPAFIFLFLNFFPKDPVCSLPGAWGIWDVYFEKIRVFKAGTLSSGEGGGRGGQPSFSQLSFGGYDRLNTLAWNNETGLGFYFVGF